MLTNLSPDIQLDQLIYELSHSKRRVLMFDYDGTLAPFVIQRNQAFAYPGVYEALNKLGKRDDTRLVIVTGRSIADIKPLLLLESLPEIIGSHGWEKRDVSGIETSFVPTDKSVGLNKAYFVAFNELKQNKKLTHIDFDSKIERKPASIAIHWRGESPEEAKEIKKTIGSAWRKIEKEYQLKIKSFEGGRELHIPGRNKGTAVNEILSNEPSDAFAAFMGDDKTDEDAFGALQNHGYGILVRKRYRITRAALWTKPPKGLLFLLNLYNT